jgi:hypothetical protein
MGELIADSIQNQKLVGNEAGRWRWTGLSATEGREVRVSLFAPALEPSTPRAHLAPPGNALIAAPPGGPPAAVGCSTWFCSHRSLPADLCAIQIHALIAYA